MGRPLQEIDWQESTEELYDARGHDASGEQVTESGNPQTGPFYIEGAELGDTLVVHLDHLYPNRDTGFSATVVAPSVIDPRAVRMLPEGPEGAWCIDRKQGMATLIAPDTKLGQLALPLAPMLGCFGVAPPLVFSPCGQEQQSAALLLVRMLCAARRPFCWPDSAAQE
jgi:acetamidase/formamidase